MPTPPLAITGDAHGAEHVAELVEVGALEHAVAADLGDHERADARPVEAAGEVDEVEPRRLGPAVIATSRPRASRPTATRPG